MITNFLKIMNLCRWKKEKNQEQKGKRERENSNEILRKSKKSQIDKYWEGDIEVNIKYTNPLQGEKSKWFWKWGWVEEEVKWIYEMKRKFNDENEKNLHDSSSRTLKISEEFHFQLYILMNLGHVRKWRSKIKKNP